MIRELAALTPGPYLHIGGDEAHSTSHADYVAFMNRVQPIVAKYGKTVDRLAPADRRHAGARARVAQYWGWTTPARRSRRRSRRPRRTGPG